MHADHIWTVRNNIGNIGIVVIIYIHKTMHTCLMDLAILLYTEARPTYFLGSHSIHFPRENVKLNYISQKCVCIFPASSLGSMSQGIIAICQDKRTVISILVTVLIA